MSRMIGWILYEEKHAARNAKFIEMFFTAGEARGIDFRLVLVEKLQYGIREGKPYVELIEEKSRPFEESPRPDFVVLRHVNPLLTRHFEEMNIFAFNNSFTAEICNDKQKTYQYLSQFGIPLLDTIFANPKTVPEGSLLKYPVVVKPVDGHGGKKVFLVRNKEEYDAAVKAILPRNFLIQKVASDGMRDLRVYVIGNEIVASVLRKSKGNFRSNYSLGGAAELYTLKDEERALAEKVISCFDLDLAGVDFLWDQGKMCLNEMEDVVGSRMLYAVSDINIVELYLDYIIDKISRAKG